MKILGLFGLLLLGLLLASCTPPPVAAPTLLVHDWRTWTLPPLSLNGREQPAPRSIACGPHDELAVLDTAGRVLVYNADGTLLRQSTPIDISAGQPEGLVMLNDGRIVICDTHHHQILFLDSTGQVQKTFGHLGEKSGEFTYPVGIAKDADENLYICEYGSNDRVQKFTREGQYLLQFGHFGPQLGQLQRPGSLVCKDGKIYVTDLVSNRVIAFTDKDPRPILLGQPPLTFDLPFGLAGANDGSLCVIEYGADRLTRVSLAGEILGQYGHAGSGVGEFATPWSIAIDSQNRVYIADGRNRRLVSLRF